MNTEPKLSRVQEAILKAQKAVEDIAFFEGHLKKAQEEMLESRTVEEKQFIWKYMRFIMDQIKEHKESLKLYRSMYHKKH